MFLLHSNDLLLSPFHIPEIRWPQRGSMIMFMVEWHDIIDLASLTRFRFHCLIC